MKLIQAKQQNVKVTIFVQIPPKRDNNGKVKPSLIWIAEFNAL